MVLNLLLIAVLANACFYVGSQTQRRLRSEKPGAEVRAGKQSTSPTHLSAKNSPSGYLFLYVAIGLPS